MTAARMRSWLRALVPTRERIEGIAILRSLAARPALWLFTRRSVPRGVAIGLLVCILLLIPGVHIIAAALLCVPLRGNIPAAAAATFVSNPATLPLIVAAALFTGGRLGFPADFAVLRGLLHGDGGFGGWVHWLASDAAPALLIGLAVIAMAAAAIGYVATAVIWRWRIARKRRRRLAARLAMRLAAAAG